MENINELRRIGLEIEQRRVSLGLSKNVLCQKFGQLGSTKTFGRVLNGEDALEGMDVGKALVNYRAALDLVNSHTEDPEENKIYADFDFMREAKATVTEALQQTDNTRLVLVSGGPGAGKTAFLQSLREDPQFARILYSVEASEAWRLKVNAFLGALLTEIGAFDRQQEMGANGGNMPVGTEPRMEKLLERINGRKIIIGIDEVHHLGVEGLNVVKTIINQTKAVVLMFAHPVLITRINKASHAEASQLWLNRLYEHIRLPSPSSGDVLEFMERRGVKFRTGKDACSIPEYISENAKSYGLWKFVKRCAKEAKKEQLKSGGSLSVQDFAVIVTRVKSKISFGS